MCAVSECINDLRRAEPDIERPVVDLGDLVGGVAIDVDAHEDVAIGRLVERQRVHHAAVDQQMVGESHRPKKLGMAMEPAMVGRSSPELNTAWCQLWKSVATT